MSATKQKTPRKVRYNRLIDIFLGITAFSLQNHLRTTVKGIGQIEIDEIYVGVDKHGRQYVIVRVCACGVRPARDQSHGQAVDDYLHHVFGIDFVPNWCVAAHCVDIHKPFLLECLKI